NVTSSEERNQGANNHGGTIGNTRSTSSQARAESMAPCLLRSDSHIADRCRSAFRRGSSPVPRAHRDHAFARDGSNVGHGRQLWPNGPCLPFVWVCLLLYQQDTESSLGLHSRLGHVPGVSVPTNPELALRRPRHPSDVAAGPVCAPCGGY